MQGRGTGQKSDAWGVTTVGRTVSGGDEAPAEARRSFLSDLRGRLLLITVGLILFALMLFYPLLAAGFRDSWLTERAQAAQIAALAVEAAPDGRVSDELSLELLDRAQVIAVVIVAEDRRELVLAPSIAITGPVIPIDLEELPAMSSIAGAFSVWADTSLYRQCAAMPRSAVSCISLVRIWISTRCRKPDWPIGANTAV